MKKTAFLAMVTVGLYGVLATVFYGCFSPDFSSAMILCSADKPDCPPEYVCAAPYCVPSATAGADLSMVTDGAVLGDGGSADLAFPPDLARSGCTAKNGYPVGRAWACPGRWGTMVGGKALDLCASGYKLCLSANPDISAADLTSCRSLKGFYVADVIGNRLGTAQPTCGAALNTHVVYGCGEAARATDFTTQCGFFGQAMDCGNNQTTLKCPAFPLTTIEQLQNAASTEGVLCCPL